MKEQLELIEDLENPWVQEAWAFNLWHKVLDEIQKILNEDEDDLAKLQDILSRVPFMELAKSKILRVLAFHK